MGPEVRSGLAMCFWPRVFHEILLENLSYGAVMWRFDWNWRINFQDGLLAWLLTRGLSNLPYGSLHRMSWGSSQYGSWLSPEWSKGEQGRSHDAFQYLALEVMHYHYYSIFMLNRLASCIMEVTIQGREHQGVKIIGVILEPGCPSKPFRYVYNSDKISNWYLPTFPPQKKPYGYELICVVKDPFIYVSKYVCMHVCM